MAKIEILEATQTAATCPLLPDRLSESCRSMRYWP